MHKFRQSGLILLSTISIIIIITLLLLSQMQQILLYAKAFGKQNENYKHLNQMEAVAEQLIHNKVLLDKRDCIIEQDEANAVLNLVEKRGCKFKNNYQFLIEDLGIFDCLVIRKNQKILASHHRRFSLLHSSETGEKSYLQIRVIGLSKTESICNKRPKNIKPGFTGWRFGIL